MQLPADRLREDLVFYSKIKLGPRVAELMKDRSEQERADKLEKFCDTLVNKDSDAPPFLLVHLVVKDMLSSRYSIHEMEECVSQQLLPHGLQKSYARILVRMEKTLQRQDKERARHLLAWASHHYPKQTISLAQLLEIMRIRTGHSDLTEEEVIDLVSETCGSLLEFRSENQTLHFTHISVLEYLRTEKEKYLQMAREFPVYESGEYRDVPTTGLFFIRSDEANILLFDDCMDYLLRKDQGCDRMFSRSLHPIRGNPIRPSDISKRYPLFPYAAQFWPYHLQRIAKHDRKYDQELRENHEKALKCLKKVEAFLNDRTFLTWMEGVIAIKRGIEWMKEQLMAVQSWLSQLKIQCDPLDIWINDISSNLFDIWEGTLLYNPNEIFFLDDTMIFRSFRRWRGSNISFHDANRDIYDILSYEEKSGIDPLFHTEARDKSLSNKFSPGEGGNASFGFISYDGNNSANKGILRIDRRCNYPRLVWEMRTPVWFDPLAHDPNGPECTKRSSIMYNCKTSYPHSLLQCLSACMSADGSQLAAIFAEIIPRSETVKMIRLATVLWEFHAPEEAKETFETWKSDFERAKQSYQTALYEAKAALDELKQLLSRTRVDLAARKIQDKLSNASSQAAISHTTMTRLSHRRPPVPSSALSHKWASPRELYPEMDEITYTDAFMTSRYLVAYKGSHHLVTPRGVYNLDGRYYEYNFGFSNFEEEFVVVPGGEYTLTFSDPVHKSLEIRQTHKDAITRRFKPTSFGDFSSFDQIVDCSSTGRLVALSLKNPRNAMTTLVVIDLVDGMFKIVLQESQVQGLRVSRAFFCPRDIHMIVTCKQDVIGQETKLFLVDIPNSKTKHLETMQLEPQAVLCSDCSDSSYYSGIGGRLLPMESASTGGAGLGDMVTDLPSDKNHNLQIRQGAYLPHALESLMRILHDTEQSEKLSCGSVGYVLQNRTILGTDNTLMDLKDVGKAEEASSGSFLPFHFRTGLCQPSSNGALVGAAYMYVQADRRQMSYVPHSRPVSVNACH